MNSSSYETLCYEKYIEAKNNRNKIRKTILELDISEFLFFYLVRSYINKNIKTPDHVLLLDKLLEIKDNEEDIIKFFNDNNITPKFLKGNLMDYLVNYRPDLYYTKKNIFDNLDKKITCYQNYLYRKSNPSKAKNKIDNNYAIGVINDFINSNYSMHRFCFNKNITTTIFRSYIQTIKYADKELYSKFLENYETKEKNKALFINEDVYNILNEIKNNPDFSIIDFCLLTYYDPLEIIKASDNILDFEDNKLMRIILKPFKNYTPFPLISLDKLININYTFEIDNELCTPTKDDKENIISFLTKYNIPISNKSFEVACKRFLKKDKKK